MRLEKDTLGEVHVPDDALYGAQTQRAVENYPVSGLRAHPLFIRAFILLKKAGAMANRDLGALEPELADAIVTACDRILRDDSMRAQFVVDVFQPGAGPSFNMNCNDVVANLANVSLGHRPGEYKPVHPNDHVNMSQSTNDVFPTALRIAALFLLHELSVALDPLAAALAAKGDEFADVIKSGRTHLQDAVPVTLGQELGAYAAAVRRARRLLCDAGDELRILGIGGTATGTGINTPRRYRHAVLAHLRTLTGLELTAADDLREAMQSQLPVAAGFAGPPNSSPPLDRPAHDAPPPPRAART